MGKRMSAQNSDRLLRLCGHFSELFQIDARCVDLCSGTVIGGCPEDEPALSRSCGGCVKADLYLYGCTEAHRWGGAYIFYCPKGLAFISATVGNSRKPEAGMILGPFVLGDREDMTDFFPDETLLGGLCSLCAPKANHLAEILNACVASGGASAPEKAERQEQLLQALYDAKQQLGAKSRYPIETEEELVKLIQAGQKEMALNRINELLSYIYLSSSLALESIKIQIIELLSVMSRATIKAGADTEEIIWFSSDCIKKILNAEDVEQLTTWVCEAFHRFINYSFTFRKIRMSDSVYKAIEYIRENYANPLALEEIAQRTHLSKAHLSRLFKSETGLTLSDYAKKMRLDKSRRLLGETQLPLAEIAAQCGFSDQSYFTKVFRAATGLTPGRYRANARESLI